jgi:hypothetical protein
MPSTLNDRPEGLVPTVTLIGLAIKLAVSVIGPFIVTLVDFVVPLYDPDPEPDQLLNV